MNLSTSAGEDSKDDSATSEPCFRKIGLPAVAGALCCARMSAPADEHGDKHAHEPLWTDLWAEHPSYGVP